MSSYKANESEFATLPRPNNSSSYGYSSLLKSDKKKLVKGENEYQELPANLKQHVLEKRIKLLHYVVQRKNDDLTRLETGSTLQLRVASLGFSTLIYLLELVFLTLLTWFYFDRKHQWPFYITAGLVALPCLIIPVITLVIYALRPLHRCYIWLWWLPTCIPLLGPFLRYLFALTAASSLRIREEHEDLAQLRLFWSFLCSAPQVVVQLYFMLTLAVAHEQFYLHFLQGSIAVLSLINTCWSVADYYSALRIRVSAGLDVVGCCGIFMVFTWRLLTIGSRLLSIALFTSVFNYYVAIPLGLHWLLCLAWLLFYRTFRGLPCCAQPGLYLALSFAQVVCWFNALRGRSRMRCFVYYLVWYVENGSMVGLWYLWTYKQSTWYHMPALAFVLEGCFVGMIFQALFYVSWRDVPCCVPGRETEIGPCGIKDPSVLPEYRSKLLYSTI